MEEAKKLHIKSIIWHNNIVVNLMVLLENNKNKFPFKINDWELVRRAVRHDFDKFEDNHSNALSYYYFIKRKEKLDEVYLKFDAHNHKEMNSHHIEYHMKRGTKPSDIDICEMVCDWIASSYKEYNDKKYDNKAKTDYWKDVIYIDAFPDTKKFITEVGIEKFKAIADLISGFKLDREFFGIDPLKEIYE